MRKVRVTQFIYFSCLFFVFLVAGLNVSAKDNRKKRSAGQSLQLLSMSVGRVDDHTVTSREVKVNYFLDIALYQPKKSRDLKSDLEIKSKGFARELSNTLLSWVVYIESKDFTVSNVSKAEIKQAVRSVKAAVKKSKIWKQLEVKPMELVSYVGRILRVKKFIRFRAEASEAAISNQDALNYFETNRSEFGKLSYVQARKNIKAQLRQKQVKKRLRIWFDVLKAKYRVQNYMFN